MPGARGSRSQRGDAVAAGLGNASLLSLGYVLLGRRGPAVGSGAATLVLLVVLGLSGSQVVEVVLVLWWAALIVHGWWLGRGRERDPRARGLAAVVTVLVLVVVTVARVDADTAAGEVERARASGDCASVSDVRAGVGLLTRLGNAPAAAEGDSTAEVCARLDAAQAAFGLASRGDRSALVNAAAALNRLPSGHERLVETTLMGTIAEMAEQRTCGAAGVADWFHSRAVPLPPRAVRAAEDVTPSVLVGCGEERLAGSDWTAAEGQFQRALALDPDGPAGASARRGMADVAAGRTAGVIAQRLLTYCSNPFPYPDAPAPSPGSAVYLNAPGWDSNPASPLLPLPPAQLTRDAGRAAHAVCVTSSGRGSVVRSCDYRTGLRVTTVRFFRTAYAVRVHEVRTGTTVLDRRVEVGEGECPPTLPYTVRDTDVGAGPPDQDLPVPEGEVVEALRRAILPAVGR